MILDCVQPERDLNINFMPVSSTCFQACFYNNKFFKVFLNISQVFSLLAL